MVLTNPHRIRFEDRKGLIIFDSGLEKVVRLSLDGEVYMKLAVKEAVLGNINL